MGLFRKKRTKVTRATGYTCPVCSNILFNMKLDGFHYYCPECTKQYNIKDLKKWIKILCGLNFATKIQNSYYKYKYWNYKQ